MHPNVPEEEVESSLDLAQLRERASYVGRAVRRHPGGLAAVAALVLLAAVLVAWALPDKYKVEARLIAQQDDLIATLSNPGRPQLAGEDNPATSTVSDMVLRRDNLLSVIRQTNLLQNWRASRPPLYQLKDWLVFQHRLSDQELTEVLAGTLEKRITVTAQPGGVVTFTVLWPEPAMAEKITQTVMNNFIENRNVTEMAQLGETISLLEERLHEADKEMDETLTSARTASRPTRTGSGSTAAAGPRLIETVELARLHAEINLKRRALEDLITIRERQVADLQAQLAQQRAVYSENYPAVANLRRQIDAMSADSPQIIDVRKQLAELEARYETRGGAAATLEGLPITRPSAGGAAATSTLLQMLGTVSRDPAEEYARGRLTSAIARYYSIADRLESAHIEREAARANIKFRYTVIKPPLPPRGSMTGPYRIVLLALGVLAAPLLGMAAAVALELRRGRLSESWQLQRSLGLPVLAVLPVGNRR